MTEKVCEWRMNADCEVTAGCLDDDARVDRDQLDRFDFCPYCGGKLVLSMPSWDAIAEYGGAE